MITYKLESRDADESGISVPCVIKCVDDKPEEILTSVPDLLRLFETCSRKWSKNGWDLEKLCTAINECEFE